jgi:peptidoglycan hydrolase-like protein with peptidoglycan-binding domain
MKRSNILLAFVATGALVAGPAFARPSRNETAPMNIKSSTLMEAQKKLNQEGFDAGRADGKWGTKTVEAVKSFQEKNNLPPTGKLDEQTLADLGIGTPSSTGRSVSETQSSQPSESSSMSSGGQQNMMQRHNMMEQEHDHMAGTPSTTGRSVSGQQNMMEQGHNMMEHGHNMMEQDHMGGGNK